MQNAEDLIFELGQFAMLVIAVCVAIMLLISFIDHQPRDKKPRDDPDPKG